MLLTVEVRAHVAAIARQHSQLADILEKIAQGIAIEGTESLAPAPVDRLEPRLELPPTTAD